MVLGARALVHGFLVAHTRAQRSSSSSKLIHSSVRNSCVYDPARTLITRHGAAVTNISTIMLVLKASVLVPSPPSSRSNDVHVATSLGNYWPIPLRGVINSKKN